MTATWIKTLRVQIKPGVRLTLALVAVALIPAPSLALSTDRDQPIAITADRAEADNKHRIATYNGNVTITQGTLRIQSDTVIVHYNSSNDLTRLTAAGSPVRFRQLPDSDTEYQTARAKRMEYTLDDGTITLIGDANYSKGDYTVAADRISYDSVSGRFNAWSTDADTQQSSDKSKPGQRVTITIKPAEK